MLNLLESDADIGTNGYCYGSGHSYTNCNCDCDCDDNCYSNSNANNDSKTYSNTQAASISRFCEESLIANLLYDSGLQERWHANTRK